LTIRVVDEEPGVATPGSTPVSTVDPAGGRISLYNCSQQCEEYYYGFGCTIVSAGAKIPVAAEFTQAKQTNQETATRVTRDALTVETPIWALGDGAYDILDWHDHLLAAGIVPVAPYNPRNTDDPLDIEYRVEDRITEHSEGVQLKQSTLDETYNCQTGVERTNDIIKDCGLGYVRTRGRVHARAQVFHRSVSPTRRCNHQRRAGRQSGEHDRHGVRRTL
jgi:Transposase DDE domain.